MKLRNLVIPKDRVKRGAAIEQPSPWPMFMDKTHLGMLASVISEHRPKVAIEIGSHHGVSTQVFLDALSAGEIEHLHIIETGVTPELTARIGKSGQSSKITIHTKPSWEVMQEADLVLIDGDHQWPALADLAVCLALQTPIVAMHDTKSRTAGIPGCWGSETAAHILSKATNREWHEDFEPREGEWTQRGFGWSVALTKNPACFSLENTPS